MAKMDTTAWILLGALLLLLVWEWQKKQAAAGSLAGGYRPATPGTAGAAGKTSLLQQLLGGTGNTQKPSAAIGAGSGAGGSAGRAPTAIAPKNPWRPPPLTQVPYASSTLGGSIPSIPPPVYTLPTMNYAGEPIPTIPSDTSNIFLTPDTPPAYSDYPAAAGYSTGTGVFTDPLTGTPVDVTGGGPILQGVAPPVYDFPTMDYPGAAGAGSNQTVDPTAFSPVDLQTIDTSTLGTISYLDSSSYATPSSGGYDPNLQVSGSGGDWASSEYGFDPGYSADTSMG
jgi:hypothetical protein